MCPQVVDIHRKQQYPPTINPSRRLKPMTIAVGMLCSDGIVLAADRQITLTDVHKYQEQKIFPIDGGDWLAVLTYAGDPGFVKEVQQRLVNGLNREEIKVDCRAIHDALEEILTSLGRQYGDVGTELLVAAYADHEPAQLWKFDGRSIHSAYGFSCLGVGDSSLISYLSKALFHSDLTIREGIRIAVYLVSKANEFIDKCGGGPDIATLNHEGTIGALGQTQVAEMCTAMESAEPEALAQIIRAGETAGSGTV
jgi:20S proteasome alpha/beta subunit